MRTTIAALLAFAAGVLLMLLLPGRTTRSTAIDSLPAAAGTVLPQPAGGIAMSTGDATGSDDGWRDWPAKAPTPEQVVYDQSDLMQRALADLGPRKPGTPNLYLIAFAGDGSEGVFRNEAEYAAQLFTRRFGPSTHALVLENNPATLETHPLADWSNLEYALDGLARVMKPDDILMLYFTSHGSEDHQLLVDMDPLPLDQISATDLPGILAEHKFKWKVVVVNACYSGGFIPPLRNPDTLVLTAARADRSSFGCGSESDITYFGHAWLVDAMNRTDNFVTAFQQARSQIARWETQDKLTPSDPQIYAGKNIAAELARWRKGIKPGPAVPFAPQAPARQP
ncbi:C13 family peptidase [Dyella sp. A6]|uniref:C13 family peptidase n=1 Tax=Dyella aluminiiresistens TaxID=3069105 RepID=UPI002E7721D0|nr:C13 family peptidase [Dyella sp. A6]